MQPAYSVSPSTAEIGDTVTVEALESDCDPRYGENARIQLIVTDSNGTDILSTTVPMSDAGGFTYSFSVPTRTTLGKASVQAYPYEIDWCDDTGQNNRVSGADISFVRASCAERIESLTITN